MCFLIKKVCEFCNKLNLLAKIKALTGKIDTIHMSKWTKAGTCMNMVVKHGKIISYIGSP